jgi:hypothetical protein
VTPATAFAECSLAPSPRQWLLLVGGHALAAGLLAFANLPWWQFGAVALLVLANLGWQARAFGERRSWRLCHDDGNWSLVDRDGRSVPVCCRVRYLARWLLVFELDDGCRRRQVALMRDGCAAEGWRQFHVLARGLVRAGRGEGRFRAG